MTWPLGDSEMAARVRAFDWSSTPLGPVADWPQSLRTAVDLMLASPQPVYIAWGPELISLYNDGYIPIAGDKHPGCLGQPYQVMWAEIWEEIRPVIEGVTRDGESHTYHDRPLPLAGRPGRPIGWFTTTAAPIRDESGKPAGLYTVALETTERVLAEDATNQRFASLFEAMDEGYLLADVLFDEAGKAVDIAYVDANPAATRMVGTDLRGRRLREVSPDYEDHWYEIWGRVARTGVGERLERYAAPEGRWYDFYVFKPDPENEKSGRVAVLFHDTTERKRLEAAQLESEQRLANVLDGMGEAFGLIDRDLRIVTQNKAALRFEGRPLEAIVGRSHWEVYPGSEDSEVGRLYKQALAEGVPVSLEHRYEWSDGHAKWLEMRAYPVPDGLAVFWHDISERKAAEAALRASEAKYRTLFETMGQGFIELEVIHDEKGNPVDLLYLELNPAFERQFGVPITQARGRRASEFFPGFDPLWTEAFDRVARTGQPERIEQALVEDRWFEVFAYPAAQGRVMAFYEEVSERKRAETRLRESEQALAADLEGATLLRKLAERLVPEENVQIIYEEILAAAITIAGSDAGTVQVYDPEDRSLVLLVTEGFERTMTDHFRRVDADSRTACGMALRTGERTFIDFDGDGTDEACIMHVAAGYLSAQAIPLVSRSGMPLGMLNTHWRAARHRPSQRQLHFLDLLARQAADLIDQRRTAKVLRESEERFRQFAEAAPEVVWIRDVETLQWEYLSPAFETIYGLSREGVLTGDNLHRWADLVVPDDRERAVQSISRVREGEQVIFEYRIKRPCDGELRWLRNTDFPIRDDSGRITRIGGFGQDVTALKQADERLREIETRQRALIEGMPQLVWRSLDQGNWTWSSPQWLSVTGQSPEQSLGLGWLEALHPDDRAVATRAWSHAAERGGIDVEYRVRRASDGAYLWHHTRSTAVRDSAGRIVEWLGTTTDVQVLKELQERQAIMVAELQHRTRNLIAVVRSIAAQTMESTGPTEAFRQEFNHRLEALARVQGLLSRSGEEPITLDTLISMELEALGATAASGRVHVNGPRVRIRNSAVQTLALALHELATNARKYGALSSDRGRLDVSWRTYEDEKAERVVIEWQETGGLPPGPPAASRGYGRELIEQALPYALNATTTFEHDGAGLRCTIDMPLERKRRRRG